MRVELHLYSQSTPIVYNTVRNSYTKDGFYCIMGEDRIVEKFPVMHIFRVREIPQVDS